MLPSTLIFRSTRRARQAIALACLALAAFALNAAAGLRHGGLAMAGDDVIEVCTVDGTIRLDARSFEPVPAETARVACCDLCVATPAIVLPGLAVLLIALLSDRAGRPRAPAGRIAPSAPDPARSPLSPQAPPA